MSIYKLAKIVKCSNPDFWYEGKEGQNIKVKEMDWPSAYVECKNGNSVLKSDLEFY